MRLTKELRNLISLKKATISFEEETICPLCKSAISPVFVTAALNTEHTASVLNYCCACRNSFISNYFLERSNQSTQQMTYFFSHLEESVPNRFVEEKFDDNLSALSPQFVKIYNQALAAEAYGLSEIAGIGYRKAVEFLVKDFAIHENTDKKDEIKALPLAKCICEFIQNPIIATLAEKSAWIGNDETHYVRKHTDRDISDLKNFIKAMVMFVGMTLVAEDAASIEHK